MADNRLGGRALKTLLVVSLCFVVLTLLVHRHWTNGLDEWAQRTLRPEGVWGELQIKADVIVEGLRPRNSVGLAAVAAAVTGIRRHSWGPLISVGGIFVMGGLATVGVKFALKRTDTAGVIGGIGGSYPSGHVVCVTLLAGCLALLLFRQPRWWVWTLVNLGGMLMGICLLVQASHWLTDVVGGLLLSGAVLTSGGLWPWRTDAIDGSSHIAESNSSGTYD